MKRLAFLLIVAVLTLTVVFIIYRPDILEKVWLWVIGLIGPIIGYGKAGLASLSKYLTSLDKKSNEED